MAAPVLAEAVTGGGAATASASLITAANAGDLLVVMAGEGGTIGTISMSAPTGMVGGFNASGGSGTTQRVGRMFYKLAAGGEQTFTVTAPSSGMNFIVLRYTGSFDPTTPLDIENGAITVAATTHATPAVTPAASAERLVVFGTCEKSTGAWSAENVNGSTTGVTEQGDVGASGCRVQASDLYVASTIAGTYTGNATNASNAVGTGNIMIFKIAAAAAAASLVIPSQLSRMSAQLQL